MAKCILEHCEFAQGGQCCLVCPKGLYRVDRRAEERRRIRKGLRMLERVMKKLPNEKPDGLPRGIIQYRNGYRIHITVDKKPYTLDANDLTEAMDIRADAEEAKENGVFDDWMSNFKAERNARKKAKETAKRKVPQNDERAE